MGILGAKSKNLQKLTEAGFPVPQFFPVSSKQLSQDSYDKLAEKIHLQLKCKSYAVRSSALVEDTEISARAGEFKTVLDVPPKDLADAILELCQDAEHKLGNLDQFSLLVQEFIEPDVAGVFFTHHPGGERGWVLEYHFGRGDKLVGGELKPFHKKGYWGGFTPKVDLPAFHQMLKTFKSIEELFAFPQDIEWCVQKGKFYILQARPITGLSKDVFEQLRGLEESLPKGNFYFEKTEISEIAPKPDKETLQLLQSIYARGGPIQKVYEKFGITYHAQNFFELLSGELYIDKEVELKPLLPAYSYFKKGLILQDPKLKHFHGLWVTLKNLYKLNRLPVGSYKDHFDQLKSRLKAKPLNDFFEDYQLIFEINLICSGALAKLKPILARYKGTSLAELLSSADRLFSDLPHLDEAPKALVGNSLDLQDASPFQGETKRKMVKVVRTGADWASPRRWQGLSVWDKKILEKPVRGALAYLKLREYARWLLVLHTNQIRPKAKRKKDYLPELILPNTLTSVPLESHPTLRCVSAGKVKARLMSIGGVKNGEKGILLTKILSPNLVEFFPNISGILSEEGGMLSHLAIMAREKGIPVLVGIDSSLFEAGQKVEMDATGQKVTLI
ncbi:MAG: PEP/pyruvate-binding domain-containing protein [Candidatus Gracilibacteria bacterium]